MMHFLLLLQLAVASFATSAKHEGTVFALWGANWAIKGPGTPYIYIVKSASITDYIYKH